MNKNRKKRRRLKVWIIILAIVGVLGLGMGGAIVATAPGRNELQQMIIDAVDFTKLRDGVYTGVYRGTKDSLRNVALEATVSSGQVTDIRVTEGALAGDKQATELKKGLTINELFDRVKQARSLQVDVISGATLTCNAHLKALENALEQAAES